MLRSQLCNHRRYCGMRIRLLMRRRIADTASARQWLAEGIPVADVLTMLEVRRRFEFSPQIARSYAVEILLAARQEIPATTPTTILTERSPTMPLLEIVQTRHINATIRLDETTAEQIDQYAAFLHASADEVVDKALAYVFAKDRDFQEFLRTPEAARAAQSLRVRRAPQNGAAQSLSSACKACKSRGDRQ